MSYTPHFAIVSSEESTVYTARPGAVRPTAEARATYVNLVRKELDREDAPENSGTRADGVTDPHLLRELLEMGMVREDASGVEKVAAVDPATVEARIGAMLRSEALTLLEEAHNLSNMLRPLIQESGRGSGTMSTERLVRIEGKAAINAIISESVERCTEELFTAQPGGGRPKATLETVRHQTAALLDRGVQVRTLYQHTAWHDGPTRAFVAEMTSYGAEFRTVDELLDRAIIIDRRLAFIPADSERDQAIAIKEPAVVRFLVGVFERNWFRARPFKGSRSPDESSSISSVLRETIIKCLIDGESDKAIAKRIGLSTRAYASHLAKLKEELRVETRFQLGYKLGRSVGSCSCDNEDAAGREAT
ncbi:hypothetical protein NX801_00955 [Streptomyces sp. LP05-1]|uniref:LuxR family transcriptional regulator n=1 Tax=Streptomyces pyxinae TaxID=2970734 RepID=A0ABT2CA22_9ACTN|nr:hypothetical protein [Streptomyces sp. LP05-1]MCS0634256.1 hypothetical protein [Streptomyces sp. LP05-1]